MNLVKRTAANVTNEELEVLKRATDHLEQLVNTDKLFSARSLRVSGNNSARVAERSFGQTSCFTGNGCEAVRALLRLLGEKSKLFRRGGTPSTIQALLKRAKDRYKELRGVCSEAAA